jgi:predicted enzyme related to lactoylglutathione lyase
MNTQATTLYPFVPSGPDFSRSIAFFEALRFEQAWRVEGLAGLRFGGAYFLLQEVDVPEWQKNQMITFEVTDLDAYRSELQAKNLTEVFPEFSFGPPTEFPWGREFRFIDPAGVCWHVRQARSE